MAAYTAVISLLQTLEQRTPELMIQDRTLESIHATAQYFHDVLEGSINKTRSMFDTEKIKSLEEKIRVAASDAQDAVELKFCQFIKVSRWTCGILQHLDLLPVVEKLDTTKKQVMDSLSHILEFSGDSLIDTSSISYPMLLDRLEDDIVRGIDDDLEIIVKRLTGPPSDLDIITISGMGGIGKTTLARKAYDHLTIRCNHFLWDDISSTLKMLPNLEELKLKNYQTSSDKWRLSDNDKFKSLKLLLLSGSSLTSWEASSDNFPNLKRLVLKNWNDLQEIPTDFGEICTLESIELHCCSATVEDSARKIVQEQEEMGNKPLKLYINKNYYAEN